MITSILGCIWVILMPGFVIIKNQAYLSSDQLGYNINKTIQIMNICYNIKRKLIYEEECFYNLLSSLLRFNQVTRYQALALFYISCCLPSYGSSRNLLLFHILNKSTNTFYQAVDMSLISSTHIALCTPISNGLPMVIQWSELPYVINTFLSGS